MIRRSSLLLVPLLLLAACSDGSGSESSERIGLERASTTVEADDDGSTVTMLSVPEIESVGRDGYVEALTRNLELDPDNDVLATGDPACIARAWIDELGPDRFEAAGISPQDLVEQRSMEAVTSLDIDLSTSRILIDALTDCDVRMIDGVLGSAGVANAPDEVLTCLRDGLTEEMVLDNLTASLSAETDTDEGRELRRPFEELATGCLPDPPG